jgi:hypothetical protein
MSCSFCCRCCRAVFAVSFVYRTVTRVRHDKIERFTVTVQPRTENCALHLCNTAQHTSLVMTIASTKQCSGCRVVKSTAHFGLANRAKMYLQSRCIPCRDIEKRESKQRLLLRERKKITIKTCRTCGKSKDVSCFGKDIGHSDGFQSECKPCETTTRHTHKRKGGGFVYSVFWASKCSNATRNKRGRNLQHSITYDFVKEQSLKCCSLSGLRMALRPYSDWQFSLERLNDGEGYTTQNVVGMCLEFQNAAQWTAEKYRTAFVNWLLELNTSYTIDDLSPEVKQKTERIRLKEITRPDGSVRCNPCTKKIGTDVYKAKEQFSKTLSYGCLDCRRSKEAQRVSSLHGCLSKLIRGAKGHAKTCDRKAGDLTLEQMKAKWIRQKGLCAYSDMCMTWNSENWNVGLERVDVHEGYTDSNTVLICREFNGTDVSVRNVSATGSGGWSREKVQFLRSRHSNESIV